MIVIDALFFLFFFSFIPISWFIDATALGFSSWPPIVTKNIVAWWVRLCDPLLGNPPLWFRAMTWFEVIVYPFFCAASCVAIYRGLGKSHWIRIPAIVFASIVGYSFLFIAAEYMFGKYKNPAPWIFTSVYVPYFIIPILFAYRTYHPSRRISSGKKRASRESKTWSTDSAKTRQAKRSSSGTLSSSQSVQEENVIASVDEPRRLRSRDTLKKPLRT
ncbi:hypothetical protein GpartN1_g6779.t1 [Galdieria partita]|uniref:EXPERA domain-containing protein n=1 Tax=Galdieria partita TaxID=83374 RepID=A0A9C7Q1Y1_9RHOD|nr:hypothetical protein GpartN1_g6779.t1 [Galdieria partita]